jgi:hypothetical protein
MVDRWMIQLALSQLMHVNLKVRALLFVWHANCWNASCPHNDCRVLCLPDNPPKAIDDFLQVQVASEKRTLREHLYELAKYGLIDIQSNGDPIVFTLQPDIMKWRPEWAWGRSQRSPEDELQWLSLNCKTLCGDNVPMLMSDFIDNCQHGYGYRLWRPFVERLNSLNAASPAPQTPDPETSSDVLISPPEPSPPPPDVDKATLLYEALADRGYSTLRVKRAIKALRDEMDACSLEELTQKAFDILQRPKK